MKRAILASGLCGVTALIVAGAMTADGISDRARKLHFSSIVVDTHDDTTQRFLDGQFDLGPRDANGSIDIPRMKEGNLDAIFFSVWIPSKITGPEAVKRAMTQIDAVREQVEKHPKDLTLATTAADIRQAHKQGKIAALLGVEGGHMINSDLGVLRKYAALGVRYMTLTHSGNDEWADSSTDKPEHNGLSDFGKDVVREMNRLGMMVDISHVSDKTFYDALEVSKAPLIASHSSCRAICDAARNMTDQMIKDLAAKGGVIQINYHVGFLSQEFRDAEKANHEIEKSIKAEVNKVVLGFYCVGALMPLGIEAGSKLPKITEALLQKGYSESDIRKILGENTLRVMSEVERVSRESKSPGKK
jgi:membrane dipeptidase